MWYKRRLSGESLQFCLPKIQGLLFFFFHCRLMERIFRMEVQLLAMNFLSKIVLFLKNISKLS